MSRNAESKMLHPRAAMLLMAIVGVILCVASVFSFGMSVTASPLDTLFGAVSGTLSLVCLVSAYRRFDQWMLATETPRPIAPTHPNLSDYPD